MSEPISREEYTEEVEEQAEHLESEAAEAVREGEYDEYRQACLDVIVDVLDAHPWFSGQRGVADHGAIIQFSEDAGVDPSMYRDLTTLAESENPAEIVQKLAFAGFEAHVYEVATDRQ